MFAIDDLGSRASNLDRIAIFRPDIIKVDMDFLRKSLSDRSYKEILYSLSQLGENLGISLLFEGVETVEELNQAMSFGSRYIQGFLFDKALNHFPEREKYKENMNFYIKSFYIKKHSGIEQKLLQEEGIEKIIKNIASNIQFDGSDILSYIEIFSIDSNFFRLYVTDLHGNQLSPNYIRKKGEGIYIEKYLTNNNWSWRPYFTNYLYQSKKLNQSWVISNPYRDLKEDYIVKTISLTLNKDLILFIDVFFNAEY